MRGSRPSTPRYGVPQQERASTAILRRRIDGPSRDPYHVVMERLPGTDEPSAPAYAYEPDEQPKRKHHWNNDYAGFITVGKTFVGKCPRAMSLDAAAQLLQEAVPWSPLNWRSIHPKRLYAIADGVLYRATETVPGRSYHGFPEHPSRFPKGAKDLKNQLLALARQKNCEPELRAWMNW